MNEIRSVELKAFVETVVLEYLSSKKVEEKNEIWVNLGGAAKYLGISRNTLKKYISSGEIKIYTVGGIKRIAQSDLDLFIRSKLVKL